MDMTKSKNTLSDVRLGRKTALKKSKIDADEVEKIVKEIHEPDGKMKMSIMIPRGLHKRAKRKALDTDKTLSDYVSDLIEQDLQSESS